MHFIFGAWTWFTLLNFIIVVLFRLKPIFIVTPADRKKCHLLMEWSKVAWNILHILKSELYQLSDWDFGAIMQTKVFLDKSSTTLMKSSTTRCQVSTRWLRNPYCCRQCRSEPKWSKGRKNFALLLSVFDH